MPYFFLFQNPKLLTKKEGHHFNTKDFGPSAKYLTYLIRSNLAHLPALNRLSYPNNLKMRPPQKARRLSFGLSTLAFNMQSPHLRPYRVTSDNRVTLPIIDQPKSTKSPSLFSSKSVNPFTPTLWPKSYLGPIVDDNIADLNVSSTTIRSLSSPCQLILVLGSLEKADLDIAYKLLLRYTYQLNLIYVRGYTYMGSKCLNKDVSYEIRVRSKRVVPTQGIFPLKILENRKKISQWVDFAYKTKSIYKATRWISFLRALRTLKSSLVLLPHRLPTSSSLYTVIKSPHVFKKTREQFALDYYKKMLSLTFRDFLTLQLYMRGLVLLKLPCEVKVLIRSG